MGILETLLLGPALAMDASAVSMTNGMTVKSLSTKKILVIGVFFGFFQFLMLVIGYFITGIVANAFLESFKRISGWISFMLLAFLGGKMLWDGVREALEHKRAKNTPCGCLQDSENVKTAGAGTSLTEKNGQNTFTYSQLFMQAIATSIDALAVGVTLQMAAISETGLALGIWGAAGAIGLVTFGMSVGAVYIGKAIGDKLADKAEICGGAVLILIGVKLLIESFL